MSPSLLSLFLRLSYSPLPFLSSARMEAKELAGYQLWQGGGIYEFPDICDILKEDKIETGNCSSTESGNYTVGIQAVAWPVIVQVGTRFKILVYDGSPFSLKKYAK